LRVPLAGDRMAHAAVLRRVHLLPLAHFSRVGLRGLFGPQRGDSETDGQRDGDGETPCHPRPSLVWCTGRYDITPEGPSPTGGAIRPAGRSSSGIASATRRASSSRRPAKLCAAPCTATTRAPPGTRAASAIT